MKHPIDLYELLPALYRHHDDGLGHPLEALLDVISTEAGRIQRDVTGLWDDFFVETAAEWAVPYIGDLVGATPLHPVAGSRRADVARTIRYRRRKGTLAMLEEMAADVTGWGARAVPFFELLEWAQFLDHPRMVPGSDPMVGPAPDLGRVDRVGTAHILDVDAMDRLDGPFDEVAHSVDIRPFEEGRGRHNIKKIGFFLWRLRSNPLYDATPRTVPGRPHAFHFSPLGVAAPLFTNDQPPTDGQRPEEADLPGPIRRLALHLDLRRATGAESRYYGPASHHSIAVAVGDADAAFGSAGMPLVPASRVRVCDLESWEPPEGPTPGDPADPASELPAVAVDPERGRLTLSRAPRPDEVVRVAFSYGFSGGGGGDIGGGPYDRRATLGPVEPADYHAVVARREPVDLPAGLSWYASVGDAVAAWTAQPDPAGRAVIEVLDNATYTEGSFAALPEDRTLEIRARNRTRPAIATLGEWVVEGGGSSRLVLNGFVVMGGALRIGSGMAVVTLRHCTLVPGRSFDDEGVATSPGARSIMTSPAALGCALTLDHCICGPIRLPAEGFSLTVLDAVVDSPAHSVAIGGPGADFGPVCDLRRVTVLGRVRVRALGYASGVLFDGDVEVERTQQGCVRFSHLDEGAVTPRRYRCQPATALEGVPAGQRQSVRDRLRPRFTSRRYGAPGYAQLALEAAIELRTGGENEAEMGAFNGLLEAQRVANLRIRLDEYLPAGLDAGLIFET